MPPVGYLAKIPLPLEFLLIPRLHLVQVLEVQLLPMAIVVVDRLLNALQLANALFLVYLRFFSDDLDLFLLLVFDLSQLSCLLLG